MIILLLEKGNVNVYQFFNIFEFKNNQKLKNGICKIWQYGDEGFADLLKEFADNSLRRLKTDYVDLYQIHRWDYGTPIEETLEALHDIVKAGKARYIGASSMFSWQFAMARYTSDLHGWTRFVSMQIMILRLLTVYRKFQLNAGCRMPRLPSPGC